MISAASARTQEVEGEGRADRQADHPGPQEQGEEGERPGDRPHDRVEVLHGDAEEAGPVGAVGGRSDGDADGGALQEEADAEDRHRRDQEHQEVVGVEDQRVDLEREVERRIDALRADLLAERSRQEEPAEREQLGEPERGDGEHEPRRPEEPADDQQLAHRAERDRGREAGAERDEPRAARR